MNTQPKLNCKRCRDSESINNYTAEHIKKQLYRGNWFYLDRHAELRAIIRVFLHELINKQPKNIYEFSAALFNCNNSHLLVAKINAQLKWINENLKKSSWYQCDGEMLFSDAGSTHSLLSTTSVGNDVENMLRYAMLLRDQN